MKSAIKEQSKSAAINLFSRIPARQRIIIGTLLIVVCTLVAFSIKPRNTGKTPGSIAAWLLRPIDPFEQARKPFIKSNLRAISRVPGTRTLIAVGSGGLILRSEDLGTHWEPRIITLTSEEIRRLRETSVPKEKERKEEKKPEGRIGRENERSKEGGIITPPKDWTGQPKPGQDRIDDTTPRVRRVPELIPPVEQKRLPEAKPNDKKEFK